MSRRASNQQRRLLDGFVRRSEGGEQDSVSVSCVAALKHSCGLGTHDPCSAGQRAHDGLLTAIDGLARSEQLPTANGTPATVVITTIADTYLTEQGTTRTGHGSHIPPARP